MRFPSSGVIPVDKPPAVTSRGVVDVVARALATKAVGHAGTLDPLAEGVVVVCVGHATRLVDFVHELPKHYAATFLLGRSSPSDDFETPLEEEADPRRPSRDEVEAALPAFRGAILQRPCAYSAVHVGGKRAYRLARRGRPLELAEKPVRIERLEVTAYDWPRLAVELVCSSGTFVRALGRDLAATLGTRAVMESLVRTAVGPFARETAVPLAAISPESARVALAPAIAAVPHLPRITLAGDLLDRAIRGALVPCDVAAAAAAAIDEAGDLVGILRPHASGAWRLRPNFRGLG
ncbi:MAG: tRNA pseudouridine(55) synthase TruB [Planctomycetota bacterium]